jgi:hypothetical protein
MRIGVLLIDPFSSFEGGRIFEPMIRIDEFFTVKGLVKVICSRSGGKLLRDGWK